MLPRTEHRQSAGAGDRVVVSLRESHRTDRGATGRTFLSLRSARRCMRANSACTSGERLRESGHLRYIVRSRLWKKRELNRVDVFAWSLRQFKLRAGAIAALLGDRHSVAAIQGLRWNNPSFIAPLGDSGISRNFESPLFACIHQDAHYWYILIVAPDAPYCQYLSYILLINTRGRAPWQKTERKSGWSSWMVVGVDAGMSGFRAETKNQRSAPSANPPDGTRQNSGPLDPVERPAARRLAPQNLVRANRDASTRPQPSQWRRPSFMRRTSYRKSLLRMVIWCSS